MTARRGTAARAEGAPSEAIAAVAAELERRARVLCSDDRDLRIE